MLFQIHDVLEKAKLWRQKKYQWLPDFVRLGNRDKQVGHREFLWQ